MPIAIISHADCRKHHMGEFHPERPERLDAIQNQLISSGMDFVIRHFDAQLADKAHLLRVHDRDYVEDLFTRAPEDGVVALDPDTLMMPHTLNAALRSAGAAIQAVDLLMDGEFKSVFCMTRPPGHHAEKHRCMGFCFFNNVAAAAAYAMERHGLERVAIVDFDVHHGNGTEDIFRDDERVMFCSSFQHPFYPDTPFTTDRPNILNLPLPAGTAGAEYRQQVESEWLPKLDAFKPQMMFISAGFDGHAEEEMAHFRLREADYAWITTELRQIALKHAEGRIVSVLEGGYALSALGRSVIAHLKALLGN